MIVSKQDIFFIIIIIIIIILFQTEILEEQREALNLLSSHINSEEPKDPEHSSTHKVFKEDTDFLLL